MANWNPWHGCHKLSAGCKNCYVYRTDARFEKDSSVVTKTQNFRLPLMKKRDGSWKIPSGELVWTCFTSDFLLEDADDWRAEAWEMMHIRSDLDFFFITKRIDRLEQLLPRNWGSGYPNVHIGCTVENQEMVDYRLPIFRRIPVYRKTIICEPLLEQLDMREYLGDWASGMVVGGESGMTARICDYAWVLDLRQQAIDAGVPFYFKQTGANFRKNGKIYRIERKFQHSQARKAGINWNYEIRR